MGITEKSTSIHSASLTTKMGIHASTHSYTTKATKWFGIASKVHGLEVDQNLLTRVFANPDPDPGSSGKMHELKVRFFLRRVYTWLSEAAREGILNNEGYKFGVNMSLDYFLTPGRLHIAGFSFYFKVIMMSICARGNLLCHDHDDKAPCRHRTYAECILKQKFSFRSEPTVDFVELWTQ